MRSHRLQLNTDKTKIIWLTTGRRSHLLPQQPLRVGSDFITPVLLVRDLGIHIDVSMRSHVMKTTPACFSCLAVYVGFGASAARYLGLSSSHWCCVWCYTGWTIAMLAGIPLHLARRLQSVMNAAARLVCASSKCDHITPLLHQLHWLKVPWRIDYRLAVRVYKCLHGLAPSYLTDELHHPAESEFQRCLHSASSHERSVPCTRL